MNEDYWDIKAVDRELLGSVISSSATICDVGGGAGVDAIPMATVADFLVLVELDKELLRIAKLHKLHNLECIRCDACHLPFREESFNIITCFSVLDHLPDMQRVSRSLAEFAFSCKRGGNVVVTVPNKLFIIGTVCSYIQKLGKKNAYFEQRFTPKKLQKMLQAYGLLPVSFDSRSPEVIGSSIIRNNIPEIFAKLPIFRGFATLLCKVFAILNRSGKYCVKFTGARFGYLTVKTWPRHQLFRNSGSLFVP